MMGRGDGTRGQVPCTRVPSPRPFWAICPLNPSFFRKYRDDSCGLKKWAIIILAITDIDVEWTE